MNGSKQKTYQIDVIYLEWHEICSLYYSTCVLYLIRIIMKNERTSKKVATLASKILRGKRYTKAEVKTVAASALTQAPDKKSRKRKK